MSFSQKGNFEYPFGKRWVFISGLMSGIAFVFAVFMLSGEGTFTLLLYVVFTSIFTVAVLALKFYLYFLRGHESPETYSVEGGEQQIVKRRLKWSFILLVCLAIVALFVPIILLYFLSPLWWLICITSYVPGVNIPEIILYIYATLKNR
jgi:hypothetical protein